ncbi:hypothetical protein D3C81_1986120 [compost metagenome]
MVLAWRAIMAPMVLKASSTIRMVEFESSREKTISTTLQRVLTGFSTPSAQGTPRLYSM